MDGYFYYYRRPKLSDKNYAVISTIVFLFLKDQVSSNYFADYVGFPMHESMLEHYNLVQRKCISNTKVYKDVLIYRKDYTLSKLEKHFLNFLCNQKETMYDANRKETMYDANRKRRFNY